MSSHPDADGFIRAILRRPADPTPRLVFADWLEETGRPGNAAWARYIRLRAEMNALPEGDSRFAELRAEARDVGERVIARLRLPAATFAFDAAAWLQVLPAANFRLSLFGFTPPADALAVMSAVHARGSATLPVASVNGVFVAAAIDAACPRLGRTLAMYLRRQVLLVAADPADVRDAIERAYLPPDHSNADPPWAFVGNLIHYAQSFAVRMIAFLPRPSDVQIGLQTGDRWLGYGTLSHDDWTSLVFPELVRQGEQAGPEFTVEVLRQPHGPAVRVWL